MAASVEITSTASQPVVQIKLHTIVESKDITPMDDFNYSDGQGVILNTQLN